MKRAALSITKNNIRPQWWQIAVTDHRKLRTEALKLSEKQNKKHGKKSSAASVATVDLPTLSLDASKLIATPDYNMCILEEMVMESQFKILFRVFNDHCAVATSIVLLLKVCECE